VVDGLGVAAAGLDRESEQVDEAADATVNTRVPAARMTSAVVRIALGWSSSPVTAAAAQSRVVLMPMIGYQNSPLVRSAARA